ncbi:serine acetyltransferase, partial [Escherichia coli]|nr:serine acetyltransferase [Escherichia coli]EFH8573023.1 serine acetyltransferase [Escherichia coli]
MWSEIIIKEIIVLSYLMAIHFVLFG